MKKLFLLLLCTIATLTLSAQDYRIYANDVNAQPGEVVDVPVYMDNVDEITAYDFLLQLPEALTLDTIMMDTTRTSQVRVGISSYGCSHSLQYNLTSNGYKVLCTSDKNIVLKGNSGQIATIRLRVNDYGCHQVVISDQAMSLPSNQTMLGGESLFSIFVEKKFVPTEITEYLPALRSTISVNDTMRFIFNKPYTMMDAYGDVVYGHTGLIKVACSEYGEYYCTVNKKQLAKYIAKDGYETYNEWYADHQNDSISFTFRYYDDNHDSHVVNATYFLGPNDSLDIPTEYIPFKLKGYDPAPNTTVSLNDTIRFKFNKPVDGVGWMDINVSGMGSEMYWKCEDNEVWLAFNKDEMARVIFEEGYETYEDWLLSHGDSLTIGFEVYDNNWDYQSVSAVYYLNHNDSLYIPERTKLIGVAPETDSTIDFEDEIVFKFNKPIKDIYFYATLFGFTNVRNTNSRSYKECYFNEDHTTYTIKFDRSKFESYYGCDLNELMREYNNSIYFSDAYAYDMDGNYFSFEAPTYYVDSRISEMAIRRDTEIDDNTSFMDLPSIKFADNYIAGLTINRTDTLALGSFEINRYIAYDYNNSWYLNNGYRDSKYYSTLIANSLVTAQSVNTKAYLYAGMWNFTSMPYDFSVGDVTNVGNHNWVIYKYSGENRASGVGDTWQKLTNGDVVRANEGFIIHTAGNDQDGNYERFVEFKFPALNSTRNNIFATGDLNIDLGVYPSEYAHNAGWNLVGNPYAAYYDTRKMSYTAPITVWNPYNNNYAAWSPTEDSYILAPGEAFFVQSSSDVKDIEFPVAGRQHEYFALQIEDSLNAKGNRVRSDRQVYNIYLSSENSENLDRTRFVINESAKAAYDPSMDAAKFAAMSAGVNELYVLANGTKYAIDERPMGNGQVQLGVKIASEGTYTLSLTAKNGQQAVLVDNETGAQVELTDEGYTFTSKAGTFNNRFMVRLSGVTAISDINTEDAADSSIYSIGGVKMNNSNLSRGLYIKNGKKVVK